MKLRESCKQQASKYPQSCFFVELLRQCSCPSNSSRSSDAVIMQVLDFALTGTPSRETFRVRLPWHTTRTQWPSRLDEARLIYKARKSLNS